MLTDPAVLSGKWVVNGAKSRVRRGIEARCAEPNAVTFTDNEGRMVHKRIPSGEFEKVKRMADEDLVDFEEFAIESEAE